MKVVVKEDTDFVVTNPERTLQKIVTGQDFSLNTS